METKHIHTVLVEMEVESSHKYMPTNTEIKKGLSIMRKLNNLCDEIKILRTKEVLTRAEFEFKKPILFGGHKYGLSVSMDIPIDILRPSVELDLNYYNEGSDKQLITHFRRNLKLVSENSRDTVLKFRNDKSDFEFKVNNDYLV